MKKHTILKTSQVSDFRKTTNNSFLLILGCCLLQLIMSISGYYLGLTKYNIFFGIMYIVSCIITITTIFLINKDFVLDNSIKKDKMTPLKFLKLFSSMIAIMILFTIPVVIADLILNQFGLTFMSVSSANEFSDNIADFIYVALLGPICEEVLFRGFLQKRLEKYTPVIAILVSSIAFGVYHGNFGQISPMIGVGLVLGMWHTNIQLNGRC